MEEFFNTDTISFVSLPDKLVCVKTVGFKDMRYDLPPIPADENPAELHTDVERHTVYGTKYIYLDGEWREIDR